MKIALFSPLNPIKSGIADYTEEMLDDLSRHFTIELYIAPGYTPSNPEVNRRCRIKIFDQKAFDPASYDSIVYQMGNSYVAHGYMYDAMKKFPGIVVLHDLVLQGFYAEMLYAGQDQSAYISLLQKFYPAKAAYLSQAIMARLPHPIWESEYALRYPLCEEIVRASRAIIVHSNFVKDQIAAFSDKPVGVIPHHGHRRRTVDRAQIRRDLGVKPDDILLCSTGYVTKNKRYPVIISALVELQHPGVVYLIAGEDRDGFLRRYRSGSYESPRFIFRNYLSLTEMEECIAASDIGINLRYPTMGENSGSCLRMMSYGLPVLVTAAGSYKELPDYAVLKVSGEVEEREAVKHFVSALIQDADFRESVGREAQDHADQVCGIPRCAKLYADFIKATVEATHGR